jgi:hypothetical protein
MLVTGLTSRVSAAPSKFMRTFQIAQWTLSLSAALISGMLMLPDHAAAYAVIGNGTMTCEAWTTARRDPHGSGGLMNEQWVVGFLSGIGSMVLGELDPLHGLDADAVYHWMDDYCRSHPLEKIEAAARVFIQEHPR